MSHELTIRNNGTVEMAYVGETPWHGLGSELEAGAAIETWTAAAGMDWRIQRGVVRYATANGQNPDNFSTISDSHVLMRSDTKAPLGIVSDKYKVVQPQEVLEFFRDLTESAGFVLDTAGTLFGGRRFWALAQIGESAVIADSRDKVKGHLLLCTSADGTLATEGRFVSTRVVCNNTLRMATRENSASSVKVTHRSMFNPSQAKKELGIDVGGQFDSFISNMRRLANTKLSETAMMAATAELMKPGAMEMARDELQSLLRTKPVTRINQLALGDAIGSDLDGTSGTAWGWLNAVTQYVDHESRARSQDNRLNSAWFGRGDSLKVRAMEMVGADGKVLETIQEDNLDHSGLLEDVLANTVTR